MGLWNKMSKGIIFDFNRTIYDPDTNRLTEGAMDLLDCLHKKGYNLSLISKKTRPDRREQISRLGLDKYFHLILVIEGGKTEQDFQKCIKEMALSSEDVTVVGDRVKSEIYIGNKLGMTTVWFRSGKFMHSSPENKLQEPDHIITELAETIKYI